jgi:GDPmannose 4,6-dehydratase
VTRAAARIRCGLETELRLGNLDAVRDWGDARDYVAAMWRMLQQDAPDDYLIATGVGRTIRDLLDAAFAVVGLDWHKYVVRDPRFYRPLEAVPLIGCAAKANSRLDWKPARPFSVTIKDMVNADLAAIEQTDGIKL